MKKIFFVFIFILFTSILFAYSFDGKWYAKLELNNKYEEGVMFKDVTIKNNIVSINGEKREFIVLDDFYIIYDGDKYYYGTRENMIVLYSLEEDYQFNRILFLRP